MIRRLKNRTEAGKQLALKLTAYANRSDVLVLGLPRGGVPVAFEIAKALNAPLDICLVRKLGVPGHQELAMGAIARDGVRVLNEEVVRSLGISRDTIERVTTAEQQELERRDQRYRDTRPLPELRDHTVILVDDGIATGATLRAAIVIVRQQEPERIVVAVPVAPALTSKELRFEVDEVVCLLMPEALNSISLWYDDFSQTTDAEVRHLLSSYTLNLSVG
ncbi:MAG TPA: phosphoribosyltransferase [Cyanophyceae cyanobacterium]